MIDFLFDLARRYEDVIFIIGIVSFAAFLVNLFLIPVLVVNLPADHFSRPKTAKKRKTSFLRTLFHVLKNILGILLLVVGLLLLVLPGPGWLTILFGLALLDFPFKHRLEFKILSIPAVRKAIERYRFKRNKAPLIYPE